jgi:hypothetical protein
MKFPFSVFIFAHNFTFVHNFKYSVQGIGHGMRGGKRGEECARMYQNVAWYPKREGSVLNYFPMQKLTFISQNPEKVLYKLPDFHKSQLLFFPHTQDAR